MCVDLRADICRQGGAICSKNRKIARGCQDLYGLRLRLWLLSVVYSISIYAVDTSIGGVTERFGCNEKFLNDILTSCRSMLRADQSYIVCSTVHTRT